MNETREAAEADNDWIERPTHVPGAATGEVIASGPVPAPQEPDPDFEIAAQVEPVAFTSDASPAPFEPVGEMPTDAADLPPAADEPAPEPDVEAPPLFSELGLSEPILRAVSEKGYLHPTPIQAQAIPYVLMGRDVLGVAQTGTGKTAGFTLPLLDILSGSRARARMPRSLILEPTRELALQVAENLVDYGRHLKLNHALLIGGESMADQKEALNRGVDVLIATPGRLIDLFERGGLLLNDTRILVIDEADRMLDMGFIPDVERIVAMVSPMRQTLFFSATMAPEIKRLADAFLQNPKLITVSRAASVATTIVAGLALVEEADKRRALRTMLRSEDVQNALIFCNRKRDVDVLAASLIKHGFSAGALHGDLAQSVRFATLERFKAGELRLLVCSDVAARGIDIGGLSHVFNFDVPLHAEDYVHRIGRTGRAGRTGHAYTIAGPEDRLLVEAIETLTAAPIPRMAIADSPTAQWAEIDGRRRRGGGGGGRRGGGSKSGERDRRSAPPARDASNAKPAAGRRDAEPAPATGSGSSGRANRGGRDRADPAVRPIDRTAEMAGSSDRRPARPAEPPRAAPPPRGDRADRAISPPRDMRGPHRRDDLGPSVLGFGDAPPDFMFLPRRRPAASTDLPVQDEAPETIATVREIPIGTSEPAPFEPSDDQDTEVEVGTADDASVQDPHAAEIDPDHDGR